MKRMSIAILAACLMSTAVPSTSRAFAIAGGATFWDNNLGDGANINFYPQWPVAFGLSPELQLGMHYGRSTGYLSGTQNFLYIPVLIGLRFDLGRALPMGFVDPFAAGHLGYSRFESFGDSPSNGTNNFAYNFAAGLNFALSEVTALGVQFGVDVVVPSGSTGEEHIYSVDALVSM